jgi:predicted alpha/beta hydrolase
LHEAPFHGALLVGAQALSWRNWDGPLRLVMAGFWYALVPALVGLVGYLPMKRFGQGDDLPPGIARDWGTWGRTPDMLARLAASRSGGSFARLAAPVRSYAISDDGYAPRRGVAALARLYTAAPVEIRDLEPRDVDQREVGHFGFFRPAVADTLWVEARTWLLRQAMR